METRIIKNIFNKNERRCRDVKTQKACEQGWEANIGPKIKQATSILTYISTALCILLYSGVSTYVGLYGSGLFNFGSYVSLPTLFACFLGFDVPTSSFIFIENVFYYSCIYIIIIYSIYSELYTEVASFRGARSINRRGA